MKKVLLVLMFAAAMFVGCSQQQQEAPAAPEQGAPAATDTQAPAADQQQPQAPAGQQ